MLRGNLASRPFYRERLVTLLLGMVGAAAVGLTVFNVSQLLALSRERITLMSRTAEYRAETGRLRAEAASVFRSTDPQVAQALVRRSREANLHLDQRGFSWTHFFDLIERTLPYGVRLVAVTPEVDDSVFQLTLLVVSRDPESLDDFVEALLQTGQFYDVFPTQLQGNRDDGTIGATLTAAYLPTPGGSS